LLDDAGNLYGTTYLGGGFANCYLGGYQKDCGTVFKLSRSLAGWTESILYRFTGLTDGGNPQAGLTFDQLGNLYGTTVNGGAGDCVGGCGVAFEVRVRPLW